MMPPNDAPPPDRSEPPDPAVAPPPVDSTVYLLGRYRAGDDAAREKLIARYLPILRRWVHGRVPPSVRGLSETEDLVQITLIRALSHLENFEPTREGAFLAWLRRVFLNAVRDQIRHANRRPVGEVLEEPLTDDRPSALEEVLGRETVEQYERALARLTEEQQEAVILRVEFGYSYQEIASALGRPTANAARMMVARGLARLAELLAEARRG